MIQNHRSDITVDPCVIKRILKLKGSHAITKPIWYVVSHHFGIDSYNADRLCVLAGLDPMGPAPMGVELQKLTGGPNDSK